VNKTYFKIVKLSAILLPALIVAELSSELAVPSFVLAQSSATSSQSFLPESILPKSIPSGSVIRINSSPSMDAANQTLKQFLESRYPGVTVEIVTTSSDEAIAAVNDGTANLAAVGRSLTKDEQAKGLAIAPIEREKIAIIIGQGNPFNKNLTFDQFARIFRGEITNWSEVGGNVGRIRVVDRPDSNDARRSLSTYKVFQGQPFQTGSTASQLPQDDTQAAIKALGTDGISYAPANQVLNVAGVKIIAMHETLPDDPRYPYSHPRGFTYKTGQPLFAAAGSPSTTPAPTVTSAPEATTAPGATVGDRGGLPWWLIPLLGIPLLAGAWWWLRGKDSETAATPPIDPIPPSSIPPTVEAIPPAIPEPILPVADPIPPAVDLLPPLESTLVPPIVPLGDRDLPKGELIVNADWGNDESEMANLPSFSNPLDEEVTVNIEAEGTWNYGAPDGENQFAKQVDGNGNLTMAAKEWQENDMRYSQAPPAALIALKNGEFVASGKGPYDLRLAPGDTISFVMNDEPHFYKDNTGALQVKWAVTETHGFAEPPTSWES
jgi:ABC-type phosphate transport system substrate-binding protein